MSEGTSVCSLQTKIKELAPLRVCEHHLPCRVPLWMCHSWRSWSLLRLKGYWSFTFDPHKTTSAPHQGKKASWRILQPAQSSLRPPCTSPSPESAGGSPGSPRSLLSLTFLCDGVIAATRSAPGVTPWLSLHPCVGLRGESQLSCWFFGVISTSISATSLCCLCCHVDIFFDRKCL